MKGSVSLHQKGGSSAATSFDDNLHLYFIGYWRNILTKARGLPPRTGRQTMAYQLIFQCI